MNGNGRTEKFEVRAGLFSAPWFLYLEAKLDHYSFNQFESRASGFQCGRSHIFLPHLRYNFSPPGWWHASGLLVVCFSVWPTQGCWLKSSFQVRAQLDQKHLYLPFTMIAKEQIDRILQVNGATNSSISLIVHTISEKQKNKPLNLFVGNSLRYLQFYMFL